jgi:hypothetical protein
VTAEPEKILDNIKNMAGQFVVESADDQQILARLNIKAPGEGWMEWRIFQGSLTQTFFFAPRGLGGFLFWYVLHPFFIWYLRSLLKNATRNSVVK